MSSRKMNSHESVWVNSFSLTVFWILVAEKFKNQMFTFFLTSFLWHVILCGPHLDYSNNKHFSLVTAFLHCFVF